MNAIEAVNIIHKAVNALNKSDKYYHRALSQNLRDCAGFIERTRDKDFGKVYFQHFLDVFNKYLDSVDKKKEIEMKECSTSII